ncbi:MAG: hypothetical protein IIB08_02405 [Bacteroidetes bacterium]|nr:hypothetical protein [Bacteroidota bacterium]
MAGLKLNDSRQINRDEEAKAMSMSEIHVKLSMKNGDKVIRDLSKYLELVGHNLIENQHLLVNNREYRVNNKNKLVLVNKIKEK